MNVTLKDFSPALNNSVLASVSVHETGLLSVSQDLS